MSIECSDDDGSDHNNNHHHHHTLCHGRTVRSVAALSIAILLFCINLILRSFIWFLFFRAQHTQFSTIENGDGSDGGGAKKRKRVNEQQQKQIGRIDNNNWPWCLHFICAAMQRAVEVG